MNRIFTGLRSETLCDCAAATIGRCYEVFAGES